MHISQTLEVGARPGPFAPVAMATGTLWAAILTGTGGGRAWDQTYLRLEKGVGMRPSVYQVESCIYRESFFLASCSNLLNHFNMKMNLRVR